MKKLTFKEKMHKIKGSVSMFVHNKKNLPWMIGGGLVLVLGIVTLSFPGLITETSDGLYGNTMRARTISNSRVKLNSESSYDAGSVKLNSQQATNALQEVDDGEGGGVLTGGPTGGLTGSGGPTSGGPSGNGTLPVQATWGHFVDGNETVYFVDELGMQDEYNVSISHEDRENTLFLYPNNRTQTFIFKGEFEFNGNYYEGTTMLGIGGSYHEITFVDSLEVKVRIYHDENKITYVTDFIEFFAP